MAFPTSGLTNNLVHKEGNRAFVYDSALGVWDQVRETERTENKILSGEIGSGVTGTLGSGVTFPTGHVLKVQHVIDTSSNTTTSSTYAVACSSLAFSVVSASSTLWITGYFQWNGNNLNSKVKSVWSTNDFTGITTINESASWTLRNNNAGHIDVRVPFSEKYTHGLAVGTNIRFRIYANHNGGSNTVTLNGTDSARMTIMEVM